MLQMRSRCMWNKVALQPSVHEHVSNDEWESSEDELGFDAWEDKLDEWKEDDFEEDPDDDEDEDEQLPKLSDEDDKLVEDWWEQYRKMKDREQEREHLMKFIEQYPHLVDHLVGVKRITSPSCFSKK